MRREALGVSQGRLGRQLGLTFSQIQKYEKGSNRIGAGRLYQIAMFLDVSLGFFFEGLEGSVGGLEIRPIHDKESELVEAYRAIRAEETRSSVLALVRSLAAQRAEGRAASG